MPDFPYDTFPQTGLFGYITVSQATSALPALTSAQLDTIPSLISQASRLAEKYTGRIFYARDYDQLYDVQQDDSIILRDFPVNTIERLSANPTSVLDITNTNNILGLPRSSAGISTTGTIDTGLTITGINLTSWTNGVQSTVNVPTSGNPTIGSLGAAINAVGNGWKATANTTYQNWPTSDLTAPQGMGSTAQDRFSLLCHTTDLSSFRVHGPTGELKIQDWGRVIAWAPDWYRGGDSIFNSTWRNIRIRYNAGFTNIPDDLQTAVILIVKHIFQINSGYSIFKRERLYDYEYELAGPIPMIPKMAMGILNYYQDFRASGTI